MISLLFALPLRPKLGQQRRDVGDGGGDIGRRRWEGEGACWWLRLGWRRRSTASGVDARASFRCFSAVSGAIWTGMEPNALR